MAWGIQPLCIKWLLAEWSPVTITAMRYLMISVILFGLIATRHEKSVLPHGKSWLYLILMGFFGILINNVVQFTGLTESTITNCTLIAATSPALTAFFAAFLIHERLSLLSWFGIVISFSGALAVISHGSLQAVLNINFNHGDVLFFISQIAWTFYSIIGLKVMQKMSAICATAWAGLLGGIMTGGYGFYVGQLHIAPLTMLPLFSFLYMVIIGGVLAMLFWNTGIKVAGPSLTSIFQNITPVVGMIGGALAFNEPIGAVQIFGALAIFSGVYLTTHSHQIADYLVSREQKRRFLRGKRLVANSFYRAVHH